MKPFISDLLLQHGFYNTVFTTRFLQHGFDTKVYKISFC